MPKGAKSLAGNGSHHSGGMPLSYTPELGSQICAELAQGRYLKAICRAEGMPDESTVRGWVTADPDGFGKVYAAARDLGLDAMAEDMLEIADDGTNDMRIVDGKEVVDYDHIQRSRLRVDTRKWYLAKLAPKRYGDNARVEMTGADGAPIELTWIAPQAVQAAPAALPGDRARDVTPQAKAVAAPPVLEGEAIAVEWGDGGAEPAATAENTPTKPQGRKR